MSKKTKNKQNNVWPMMSFLVNFVRLIWDRAQDCMQGL